jgi:hypothetical protein
MDGKPPWLVEKTLSRYMGINVLFAREGQKQEQPEQAGEGSGRIGNGKQTHVSI